MVVVDSEKCARSGPCERMCLEPCMSQVDSAVETDQECRGTCTQGIAVCPEHVLSRAGVPALA